MFDAELRAKQDLLSATIIVAEIKLLFLEYQERGVIFHQALRTEPWGARTFIVADPDGNLIAFAGETHRLASVTRAASPSTRVPGQSCACRLLPL